MRVSENEEDNESEEEEAQRKEKTREEREEREGRRRKLTEMFNKVRMSEGRTYRGDQARRGRCQRCRTPSMGSEDGEKRRPRRNTKG